MLHPALERERRAIIDHVGCCVRRLREQLPLLTASDGSEALHELRIQLRRLRSVFVSLQATLPLDDAASLAIECRWLAGRGSGQRDIDVLLHRMDDYLDGEAVDVAALGRLQRVLRRRRGSDRRTLRSSLHTRRAERFLQRLDVVARHGVDDPGWGDEPAVVAALRRAYRRVRRLGRRIVPDSPPEDLHELRKCCKRLRYLLELYASLCADTEVGDTLRRLRRLQKVLGDHQDFDAHAALLRSLRAELSLETPVDTASCVLIDRLLAVLAERASTARVRSVQRFARFDKPGRHQRRRRLFATDPLLAPPMLGSGGYCHGWASGRRIALPVGKVVCVGRNYAAHAAELGNVATETPLLFIKPPSAVVDLAPRFRLPSAHTTVHHELEIAVLVGRRLRDARPEEAHAAIIGVGLGLDLTLREEQDMLKSKAHPWEVAKGFDGACPLSAFVRPVADINLERLETSLSVNGALRQCGNSSLMLMPIVALLCHASRHFSLWPGDVVLTGTPAGVAALEPGDRIVATLGSLLRVDAEVMQIR